jgi:hypothetical protein
MLSKPIPLVFVFIGLLSLIPVFLKKAMKKKI